MKNYFSLLMVVTFLFAVSCTGGQKKSDDSSESSEKQATVEEIAGPNELTGAEQEEGWMLLFDGETSEGWRGVNKDHFPAGWEVVDGTLHCKESGQGEAGAEDGGDILYDQKFSNFVLKFDWKISEGGNSGVFYLGQEVEGEPIWKTKGILMPCSEKMVTAKQLRCTT
jgi:hypothetical protein